MTGPLLKRGPVCVLKNRSLSDQMSLKETEYSIFFAPKYF